MDFTLEAYKEYVEIIIKKYDNILRFDKYFTINEIPKSFVIFRHDVDRSLKRALNMARIENSLGVSSTYYFRMKPHTFIPPIITEISELGHEIGYHYESLSDTNGSLNLALNDFKNNLEKLRRIAPISTISMHGRPLNRFDNRDIWKNKINHKKLLNEFGILGEVYLDIDYADIAYINDTGRNWSSSQSNIRDKIISHVNADFNTEYELRDALENKKFDKIIFQIHPERWNNKLSLWILQYIFDFSVNVIKSIIK